MFAKSKIRPCQRLGQLFAENEICATVQYQVSICCNTSISDEISKYILVQKFDAFYLSNTAGIHNVAFFFSAIASQEKKSGSINENTEEESSSGDEIPSSIAQQWLEGNLTNVNKSLCPAIAYWVALTTVNGAPASPISVHKALLNSGLEVTATQVIKLFSYFSITQAFP